jgi:hypothetical protein
MKKMNLYRLQYWLYAVFNNEFSKDVELRRDPLHSRYSVNRHGFSAHGRKFTALMIFEAMVMRLRIYGYEHDPKEVPREGRAQMVKRNRVGDQIETIHVNLTVGESMNKSERPFVDVWPAVYYSRAHGN